MTSTSLKREIIKLGGVPHDRERGGVTAEVNGYDVEMIGESSRFFTVRRVEKRGAFDPGSDYNSGDYSFYHRIKELAYAVGLAEWSDVWGR